MSKNFNFHKAPETTTWLTPLYIIEALGEFDLDPCAAPGWPTAKKSFVLPTDGLAQDWEGRVWCNPPYGRETWAWMDKLAEHGQGTALIFARTETKGFQEHVWAKADAILFLSGRIKFYRGDKTLGDAANAPSSLIAYGPEDAAKLESSGLKGAFVHKDRGVRMLSQPSEDREELNPED